MAVEKEPCHLKWEAGQAMPSDPQGGAWDDEGMGGVALCAFFRSLKSQNLYGSFGGLENYAGQFFRPSRACSTISAQHGGEHVISQKIFNLIKDGFPKLCEFIPFEKFKKF